MQCAAQAAYAERCVAEQVPTFAVWCEGVGGRLLDRTRLRCASPALDGAGSHVKQTEVRDASSAVGIAGRLLDRTEVRCARPALDSAAEQSSTGHLFPGREQGGDCGSTADRRIHLLLSAERGAVQRGEDASRGATARGLLPGPVRVHASSRGRQRRLALDPSWGGFLDRWDLKPAVSLR